MAAIGRVLGWIGRRGILFVALVAAILLYWSLKPSFEGLNQLRQTAATLSAGSDEIEGHARNQLTGSDAVLANAHRLSRGQLIDRIVAAQAERRALQASCGSDLRALLSGSADAVIANRKACIRATLLTREIAALTSFHDSLGVRVPGETVPAALRRHARTMDASAAELRDAKATLVVLRSRWFPPRAAIQTQLDRIDRATERSTAARRAGETLIATRSALAAADRLAAAGIASARADYAALVDERARSLSDNGIERAGAWAEANNLSGAIRTALIALLAIILTPYLIRLFCYFILAPIAMRRPAIRIRIPGGDGIVPAARSTTSVAVRLDPGEELLVRHPYLQSTSQTGAKSVRWLLDWRHPLTSLATGLTSLVRIRGDGEVTTVSPTRDPLAEVTILTLPAGSACVLQPRALAAVAQPIGQPLRVTSHWRLFSLNAWLTLQLRFLVFHGPARLVIKGGRGVRVERAEAGRIFGQDQLVGFSSALAYSVTRTEIVWLYLLGREPLLKDRVAAGGGVLIVEEAPLAGTNGRPRRGIEGMIDAAMKLVGM